jgi:hypothetical protein
VEPVEPVLEVSPTAVDKKKKLKRSKTSAEVKKVMSKV